MGAAFDDNAEEMASHRSVLENGFMTLVAFGAGCGAGGCCWGCVEDDPSAVVRVGVGVAPGEGFAASDVLACLAVAARLRFIAASAAAACGPGRAADSVELEAGVQLWLDAKRCSAQNL